MYPINRVRTKDEYRNEMYLYECINSANQKVRFYLTNYDTYYFAVLYIMSKKKREFETLKQTGKDGLKSLVWVKNCMKDFIDNIAKKDDLIIVQWDDSRRKRAYAYGLKSLGFHFGRFEKKESLMLKIK